MLRKLKKLKEINLSHLKDLKLKFKADNLKHKFASKGQSQTKSSASATASGGRTTSTSNKKKASSSRSSPNSARQHATRYAVPDSDYSIGAREVRLRTRITLFIIGIGFLALIGRASYLQIWNKDFLLQKGQERYSRVIEISANRGIIRDRFGDPLAISTPVDSVWASPANMEIISQEQFSKLAMYLGRDEESLRTQLAKYHNKEFIYLKRHLAPENAVKIMELGIPGIFTKREYKRYYPAGEILAHILGFTNLDDKGQEGLELAYQSWLSGTPGSRKVIKDRLGHVIEEIGDIKKPKEGKDIVLSIDRNIQYLAYRELKQAMIKHNSKGGGIVVLDAKNGEILALANVPSFNPNNRAKYNTNNSRNRAIIDMFEPGSTLKPFAAAAALDANLYRPDSKIDTGEGKMWIGPAVIHDAHPQGELTLAQVIQKSSNVGISKISLSMNSEYWWTILTKSGFGTAPYSGFPGEASGRLRHFQTWRPIEKATISYGHGMSVSLLQLARAYTVFASDGLLKPVSLLKRSKIDPNAGQRVFNAKTAVTMRKILEMVVEPGGTAPRAQVIGYRVAGKTGTSHKLEGGVYAPDKYVSSFVGFAPATNPRVIIAVMIDEPTMNGYYGGIAAAPVFSRVMSGTLRILGIPPDAPTRNKPINVDNIPEVKESV